MSEMSNAPSSVLQIWGSALTRPNEQTYAEISSSPRAKATTAYLWVFVASLIQIFLVALVQSQLYGNLAEQFGLDMGMFDTQGSFATVLVGALCGAPIGAAITTFFFAIGAFVIQWLAKMFGGQGTYDQLAYALGAIVAPYTIVAGIMTLLAAIPYVGLCISGILFLAGFYILVLQVMAIKGVNRIGWGAAIGALLIPALVISLLCACLVGVSAAALFPLIQEAAPNFTP
jgi:hypothetical protein